MENFKHLIRAWFWESLQNTPLIMAFTFGYDRFRVGEIRTAAGIILLGVTAGALMIRFTENRIQHGQRERWRVTILNILFFAPVIALYCAYFSRVPANLPADIIAGAVTGWLASRLQSGAAGNPPSGAHSAALALSFSIAILLIRQLVESLSPWHSSLLINLAVTTVIVLVEYREPRMDDHPNKAS